MTDSEPVDAVAPWTIKSCPTSTRDAVTMAARKEGLTVGQWLTKRVEQWTADGQPVVVNQGKPAMSGEALAAVMQGVAALAAATGVKPPVTTVRQLYAAADDIARDERGIARRQPRLTKPSNP